MKRATQLSFVDRMERPTGPIPGSVQTGTNADLIATIAPIYLTGSVLDTTYGRGKWWDRFKPQDFTFHDINLDGVDFRRLPYAGATFDAVCFDPPYLPQSKTTNTPDFTDRFGLSARSQADLDDLIRSGISECARVSKRWLLVKCMDYVNGGRLNIGSYFVLKTGADLGLRCWDVIIHNAGTGPGGHNISTVLRCRRAHSYLIVFEVPKDYDRRLIHAEWCDMDEDCCCEVVERGLP